MTNLGPSISFPRDQIAFAHVMTVMATANLLTGETVTYKYRSPLGGLLAIAGLWMMAGPKKTSMRVTLKTRTEEAQQRVEIARQSTNAGAYIDTAGSWTNGVATLTIGANTILVGDTITVSGVTPTGFNGTFPVTAVTGTTVSYPLVNNPGAWVSAGTEQTATKFPPPTGLMEDESVTDQFGNVLVVRKIESDEIQGGAIFGLTGVVSQTTQAGVVGQ